MCNLFILFILSFLSYLASPDCRQLKEGTFKLENKSGEVFLITRSGNTQQENVVKKGLILEYDLKWLTDCRYILYNRRLIQGTEFLHPDIKPDTLFNEIVKIKKDKHVVVSQMKGYDLKVKATLVRQ